MKMSEELSGKVYLVSGAAGAMGMKCVELLAAENAKLGLMDLTENVHKVAEETRKSGVEVVSSVGDICSESDVRKFVGEVHQKFGRIDGVLNIAAIYKGLVNRDFSDIPMDEWERVLRVNITGTWMLTKEATPFMKKNGKGSVVNISSATVFFGAPGMLHYVASKAAVLGMTKAMAQELGPSGIRVNCIAPGLLPTESSLERITDAYVDKIKATAALRKLATPDDIVKTARFLLSDDSESITGQTIVVDAGRIFL